MTDVQILQTLRQYFGDELGANDLGPDDPLLSRGLLDSLAIVKLLSFIEDEFDVEIADADFDPENFETLSSITKLIANPAS
jgi:acyl carrier protein